MGILSFTDVQFPYRLHLQPLTEGKGQLTGLFLGESSDILFSGNFQMLFLGKTGQFDMSAC